MKQSRSQLAKVARLYWLQEIPQREIATKLNVSVASVSRMLTRARELGIVRINVEDDHSGLQELEVEIERRFGLQECLIAPAFEELAHLYTAMAQRLGELLERHLAADTTLGVSWGETLKRIGEELPEIDTVDIRVVPIVGAMGRIETGIYPNSIAQTFAEKLRGVRYLVNTPAVLDSPELKESVIGDSNFKSISAVWQDLDVVIFSVSALDQDASVYKANIFSEQELREVREQGAVAAVNFAFVSEEGEEVDTDLSRRIVNLPLSELRHVRQRVLVARGENKVQPIRAALRGALCDTLVTDAATAQLLCSHTEAAEVLRA